MRKLFALWPLVSLALLVSMVAGCASNTTSPPAQPQPFSCSSEMSALAPVGGGGQIAPLCGATPYSTPPAGPVTSSGPAATRPARRATQPATALRAVHDPGQVTGTLQGPCHTRDNGRLPDPRCTPGAYDPQVTAAVLCAPGRPAVPRSHDDIGGDSGLSATYICRKGPLSGLRWALA